MQRHAIICMQTSTEEKHMSTRLAIKSGWVQRTSIDVDWPLHKLAEWQLGPFEIIKIISSNAVKLKLSALYKIHNVIKISHLHPYKLPLPGQSSSPSELVVIEEEHEYRVEDILDSRLKCGKLEYLVKWSGYTDNYNTWKLEANCQNFPKIIENFY